MSGSHSVLKDQSLLSKADLIFLKLESVLTLIGGVVIFLLVFLATANVLGRWIFSLPISGYIDWVELALNPTHNSWLEKPDPYITPITQAYKNTALSAYYPNYN